jgi:hypothetical protein
MFDFHRMFADQIELHRRHVGTIGYYLYWCHASPNPIISHSEFRSTRLWELSEVCDALLIADTDNGKESA